LSQFEWPSLVHSRVGVKKQGVLLWYTHTHFGLNILSVFLVSY